MTGEYLGEGVGIEWLRPVLGLAAVMVGLSLLLRQPGLRRCVLPNENPQAILRIEAGVAAPRVLMPGGLFLLGVSMALTPCVPLGTVLFSAAITASTVNGLILGLGFGLGLAVQQNAAVGTRELGIASVGSFGWPGVFGTWWQADPAQEMILIFLVPGGDAKPGRWAFQAAAYEAIVD